MDARGLSQVLTLNARLSLRVVAGEFHPSVFDLHLMIIISSFSVLPALSLTSGIIHCNIREGSFRTESFKAFILGLLDTMQPYPAPNSVIVMDNCKIHKREDILEAIYAR